MRKPVVYNFGLFDDKGDAFEFLVETTEDGHCHLVAVVQTERGPRRTDVASIPARLWHTMVVTVVKELAGEMGEDEREKKKPPTLQPGVNRLSPLVGRELGVLLMALMEEGATERADKLLAAWRELAREERWWLYSKAAAPGQRQGAGWRRALFHALSETSDTRSAPVEQAQKKTSGSTANRLPKRSSAQKMPVRSHPPTQLRSRPKTQQQDVGAVTAGKKASLGKRPKTMAK